MGGCSSMVRRINSIEATLKEFTEQVEQTKSQVTDTDSKLSHLDAKFTEIGDTVGSVKGDCGKVFVAMDKVPEMKRQLDQIKAAGGVGAGGALMNIFGGFMGSSPPQPPPPPPPPPQPPVKKVDSALLAALSSKAQKLYQEGKRQQAYETFLDCYKRCSSQLGEDDTNTLNCKAWAAHIEDELATYSDSESDAGLDV